MLNSHHNLLFKAFVLAVCVISSVHVFVFPLYGVESTVDTYSARPTTLKTYKNFEQSLCIGPFKPSKIDNAKRSKKCPNTGIVTVAQGGRLGNQIWEYASVWALSRRSGLEPFVPRCIRSKLDQIFASLTLPTFQEIRHCHLARKNFAKSFDEWSYTNQTASSILLPKYVVQPELILAWIQELRVNEFRFRRTLLKKAERILREAEKAMENGEEKVEEQQTVFVGLHVRRTDYLTRVRSKYKTKPATADFYSKSMRFFTKKYKNVVFVVVSDDPKWCEENLRKNRVYIVASNSKMKPNSPELDLTILSQCNHSIFDYGTFGQWGALLAGGDTIFYGIKQHSSYKIGQLLPNWYGLT